MKAKITLLLRNSSTPHISTETSAECAKKAFDEWSEGYDVQADCPAPYITLTDLTGVVFRVDCTDISGIIIAEDLATPSVLVSETPGLVVPKSMQN